VSVIVIEFITLDGVVSDPDGSLSAERAGAAGHAPRHRDPIRRYRLGLRPAHLRGSTS
jgi:hypothetical protein